MSEKQVAVVFCAPFLDYPEQPKDQSQSELIQCPHCDDKMWLSEKKKFWMNMSKTLGNEIILACYVCFAKMVADNPDIMNDHVRIDL